MHFLGDLKDFSNEKAGLVPAGKWKKLNETYLLSPKWDKKATASSSSAAAAIFVWTEAIYNFT